MAYGHDPEQFKDVVVWGGLPQFPVEICAEEYEIIALAFDTLIGSHIDRALAEKILGRNWLPEQNSQMLIKYQLN